MRETFTVAPGGLAAARPRLHDEAAGLGRLRAETLRLLDAVQPDAALACSGAAVVDLMAAVGGTAGRLADAVAGLGDELGAAARRYQGVDVLVAAATPR